MPWISVGISELESDSVEDLWEQPVSFDDLKSAATWIIHGKKGSGKSTVVDYLSFKDADKLMVMIKPAEEPTIYELFCEFIQGNSGLEEHAQVLAAERFIEVLVTTALMRHWFERRPSGLATGGAAVVYDFLTRTGAISGSILRKAIRFLEAGTKHSPLATGFRDFLENDGNPSFAMAREAFTETLKAEGSSMLIACIDDIDDVNFRYGHADRVFLDALVGYVFSSNTRYVKHGIPIRAMLTIPSELYEHRRIWGSDKVHLHAAHLKWSELARLRALVNKRIGIRLNRKRRHPGRDDGKYSIASAETWEKIFPKEIANRREVWEDAFEYCVRHTFYTPREVLTLVDSIYEDSSREEITSLVGQRFSDEWSELFRNRVAARAQESANHFVTMFNEVYGGVESTVDAFRNRPNIWGRRALEGYLESTSVSLSRRDAESGEALPLVQTLYQMGFLGLGIRDERHEAQPTKHRCYDVRFTFLSSSTFDPRWELAVIAPVFYDLLGIRSRWGIVVRPHTKLQIQPELFDLLATYNHAANTFAE